MNLQRELSSIAIVAPFYNEEAGAHAFYEKVREQLDKLGVACSFVFVDDGSEDQTLAILNAIADHDSRVRVLSLARNFGHQIALTAGLDHVDADAVVVMDVDLQHPPEKIIEMVQHFKAGADVVYGVRKNAPNMSLMKRLTSDWFYVLLERMTNVPVVRGSADFRLMSRRVLMTLRDMREMHRYLRGMVPWMGFPYAVVYYEQGDRYAGQATYTWRKSLKLAKHGLFSFSTVPLDLITWLGLLLAGGAALYLVYVLIVAVLGYAVPGWASVIAVLLIVGGVQLISIGVLAQYIGMVFEQVKKRPLYVLKQKRLAPQQEAEEESG